MYSEDATSSGVLPSMSVSDRSFVNFPDPSFSTPFMIFSTTLDLPFLHAICRAVSPYLVVRKRSAPWSRSSCTHLFLPFLAELCSGVQRSRSVLFGSALCSSSFSTALTLLNLAAKCSGVQPSASSWLTFAPRCSSSCTHLCPSSVTQQLALCRAVMPSLSSRPKFDPASSSSTMQRWCPFLDATWSGLHPCWLASFTSAFACSSSPTASACP
mmetsp:Transcript_16490/g.37649  ORF Transcript_16490/g.37649 Transcript_16490/m.37649 type:complete len:213 (-) Transcript_16490:1276-1914(-)